MDERALKALKGSIAKWEAIVAGTGADCGTDNCPLCAEFVYQIDSDDTGCFGCPVSAKTGQSDCAGSPYYDWAGAHDGDWPRTTRLPSSRKSKRMIRLAQAELDFLRSLLPEEATP